MRIESRVSSFIPCCCFAACSVTCLNIYTDFKVFRGKICLDFNIFDIICLDSVSGTEDTAACLKYETFVDFTVCRFYRKNSILKSCAGYIGLILKDICCAFKVFALSVTPYCVVCCVSLNIINLDNVTAKNLGPTLERVACTCRNHIHRKNIFILSCSSCRKIFYCFACTCCKVDVLFGNLTGNLDFNRSLDGGVVLGGCSNNECVAVCVTCYQTVCINPTVLLLAGINRPINVCVGNYNARCSVDSLIELKCAERSCNFCGSTVSRLNSEFKGFKSFCCRECICNDCLVTVYNDFSIFAVNCYNRGNIGKCITCCSLDFNLSCIFGCTCIVLAVYKFGTFPSDFLDLKSVGCCGNSTKTVYNIGSLGFINVKLNSFNRFSTDELYIVHVNCLAAKVLAVFNIETYMVEITSEYIPCGCINAQFIKCVYIAVNSNIQTFDTVSNICVIVGSIFGSNPSTVFILCSIIECTTE